MQDGPITVFAPNDDALGDFAKAQGLSKVDLMNYDGLKDVILNHVAVYVINFFKEKLRLGSAPFTIHRGR